MSSPLRVDMNELSGLVGRRLGPTAWTPITQPMVDTFADLTGDHQWIHVDPERAATGPFGATIAHGYLTLSLVPVFFGALLDVTGASMGVNYGLERARFPSPVKVGDQVRATVCLAAVTALGDDGTQGFQSEADVEISSQTSTKPACVARIVFRFYRRQH